MADLYVLDPTYVPFEQISIVDQIMNDLDSNYNGQIEWEEFVDFLEAELGEEGKIITELDECAKQDIRTIRKMLRQSKNYIREMRIKYYDQWDVISDGKGYVTRDDLEMYRDMLEE